VTFAALLLFCPSQPPCPRSLSFFPSLFLVSLNLGFPPCYRIRDSYSARSRSSLSWPPSHSRAQIYRNFLQPLPFFGFSSSFPPFSSPTWHILKCPFEPFLFGPLWSPRFSRLRRVPKSDVRFFLARIFLVYPFPSFLFRRAYRTGSSSLVASLTPLRFFPPFSPLIL